MTDRGAPRISTGTALNIEDKGRESESSDTSEDSEGGDDLPQVHSLDNLYKKYFQNKTYSYVNDFDEQYSRGRYNAAPPYKVDFVFRDALRGTYGLELKSYDGKITYKRHREKVFRAIVAINGFLLRQVDDDGEERLLDETVRVISDTPVELPLFIISAPLNFDAKREKSLGTTVNGDSRKNRELTYGDGSSTSDGNGNGGITTVALTQQDDIIDVDSTDLAAKAANIKSQIAEMSMCTVIIEWAKPYFNTSSFCEETTFHLMLHGAVLTGCA